MDLQVKCEECGADLAFKPGTKSLTCNYCDHSMEFAEPESADEAHKELDLDEYINNYDKNTELVERQVIHCQGCGAETEMEANQQSSNCPFCDIPLILDQVKTKNLIKPKGILPFKVERKYARANFKSWLSKLWFAPNNLKKQITKHDKFKGIYLPFWTYDCDTNSTYSGQRGDHYYVTVSGTDSEGNSTTRQERRTRWSMASGRVYCNFDDIMVVASKSLPENLQNALEPWDLPELVDYKDEYLSGYVTETYQIGLKEGYASAKGTMDKHIYREVERDIGGDVQRVFSVNTRYLDATFKHILLPVWVSAYRFKKKLYQILVNARTGEVQGSRPYSWVKITLAVLAVLAVIGAGIYLYSISAQ